jgi:hypothetical protein
LARPSSLSAARGTVDPSKRSGSVALPSVGGVAGIVAHRAATGNAGMDVASTAVTLSATPAAATRVGGARLGSVVPVAPVASPLPVTPVPAPEQQEAPSSYGVRLTAYVRSAEKGGGRRTELEKSAAEARRTVVWLEKEHPEWMRFTSVKDAEVRRDLMEEHLAKMGHGYVSKARCGVCAFERFVDRESDALGGAAAWPAAEDVVAWYALDRTDRTRATKAAAGDGGSAFKGTSGKAGVKGIGYAVAAFGATLGFDMKQSKLVTMAQKKPPDAERNASEEAHMGCFVQCWMEEVGANGGSRWCEQVSDWAVAFAACGLGGVRDVEALRSKFAHWETVAGGEDYSLFHCLGGKGPSQCDLKPFTFVVWARGSNGSL